MKQLAGVFISFIGFLLLFIAGETKDLIRFQFSAIFSLPLIYFGLKFLMS